MPPEPMQSPEQSELASNAATGERFHLAWAMLALVILTGATFALYWQSPVSNDFYWSDAPRHALNGMFVHDLIAAMPGADPYRFAVAYYLQYPALTILFYPPFFYGVLAASFAMFGFSHAVAQGTVMVFYLAMGCLYYALARRWLHPLLALGAGLLLMAAPEISVWGRQVMLDIPAYAWLLAMSLALLRYLGADGRPRHLYWAVLLLTAALYTKQTPLFVVPAVGVALLVHHGLALPRQRQVWIAAVLLAVLLIPLVAIQLKFGQVNTASLMGTSERPDVSRLSLAAWTYYLTVLPSQLGWPTVVLAVTYLIGCIRRPAWRLPRAAMAFFLAWLVFGYLMFSFIMVREPRHTLMVLMPLPLFAILAVRQLLPARRAFWLGGCAAVALAVGQLAWSLAMRPVSQVGGYLQAAQYVAAHAPKGSVVMFSGYRDGSFIFSMREMNRLDLSVARSDKVLFRVAIERERGILDRGRTAAQLTEFFHKHAVQYIVYEPDFWQDLPSMQQLSQLLADTSLFRLEQSIDTVANFDQKDRVLRIYRYLGPMQSPPEPLSAELVGVGMELKAK